MQSFLDLFVFGFTRNMVMLVKLYENENTHTVEEVVPILIIEIKDAGFLGI